MAENLDVRTVETPAGKMQIIASEKGLCALEFIKTDRQKLLDSRLQRWFDCDELGSGKNIYIEQALKWLKTYFAGRFDDLQEIKLDMRGTPFELKVWKELRRIPLGETISYGELAARVGIPKAPRAAGGASRRNPVGILVPCHRVIGKNGSLTGYGGGLDRKKMLLDHELKN